MLAYKMGITKAQFVNEMKKHKELDDFIRGQYWNDDQSKGCAVGCGLESIQKLSGIKIDHERHSEFEPHLGWPEWLARLQDCIFENCSFDRHKKWPIEIAEAINEGSDLEMARIPVIIMILEHSLESLDKCVFDHEKFDQVKKSHDLTRSAINQMILAHKSNDLKLITAARFAAESARSAAESAAESAARFAAESARSAARSAAESARSAAWSARFAAESARFAAESARSAAESAESAAFDYYADRILEILKETK